MELSKKQLVLTIVAVVTLVSLVAGATYAYFAVNTTDSFNSSSITGNAGSIGSVILQGNNANLSMSLSLVDMMKGNANTYYASNSGKTTTPTTVTIGTASVLPSTDTNYYHCTYTLSVTHSGTNDMYNLFNSKTGNTYSYTNRGSNQIVLTINGTDYDFTGNWPSTINGEFNTKVGSPVNLTAALRFVNSSTLDQSYLAGSDISIGISVVSNSLKCEVVEEPQELNWVYYGWNGSTPSSTFAGAAQYGLSLRSNTGVATYDGIDGGTTIVETCYEYNSKLVCVRGGNTPANTYNNSSYVSEFQSQCTAAGGTFSGGNGSNYRCQMGSAGCILTSDGYASCDVGADRGCGVYSDGCAECSD